MNQSASEEQGRRSGVVGCWYEVIGVIRGCEGDFTGLRTSTMSRIVVDRGHKVLGGKSGMVDGYYSEIIPCEATA
jgi:hypothetical protein